MAGSSPAMTGRSPHSRLHPLDPSPARGEALPMDKRKTDPSPPSPPPPPAPRTGPDGKPYDQEFFLALARRGKAAWNRWCKENPRIIITFAGIDFTAADNGVDFSGF